MSARLGMVLQIWPLRLGRVIVYGARFCSSVFFLLFPLFLVFLLSTLVSFTFLILVRGLPLRRQESSLFASLSLGVRSEDFYLGDWRVWFEDNGIWYEARV